MWPSLNEINIIQWEKSKSSYIAIITKYKSRKVLSGCIQNLKSKVQFLNQWNRKNCICIYQFQINEN